LDLVQRAEQRIPEPSPGLARMEWHRRLVADALAGAAEARREIVERLKCVPRFLAIRNARLGHPFAEEERDELIQETLVTIWAHLDTFEGRSTVETWACGCLRLILWRRLRVRAQGSCNLDSLDLESSEASSAPLDHDDVYRALEQINKREALIVRYRHLDSLAFDEIAERMGVSFGCVKSRYYRGLARLREILGPTYQRYGW